MTYYGIYILEDIVSNCMIVSIKTASPLLVQLTFDDKHA